MAALSAAAIVAAEGVEPILHVATRDRNRIALISEALGAQALGVRNILCTSGSHQTLGRFRAAKNVYDIDSIQLLQAYANLAGECKLVGEDGVVGAGPFCLGAVASPDADPLELQVSRLLKKTAAGGRVSHHPAGLRPGAVRRLVERGEAARRPPEGRRRGRRSAARAGGTGRGEGRKAASVQDSRRIDRPRRLEGRFGVAARGGRRNSRRDDRGAVEPRRALRLRRLRRRRQRCGVDDYREIGAGEQVAVPAKYSIHTKPAAPRFRPVGKLGIVDWREDCSSCHNCVKRGCVYGLYRDEADALRDEIGYLDYIYQCKGCLNCVQNCTKNILTRVVNPEYRRLGDAYYSPDIILSTWFQSETGRIPVSGAGYGGPFSGPGFDSMWTDMSEIVRPTRDGIHGREYISTSVDIGRKLPRLTLVDGQLADAPPPLLEAPLPVIFDVIPEQWRRGPVVELAAAAAAAIGTLAVVRQRDVVCESSPPNHVVPLLETADAVAAAQNWAAPLVMIEDHPDVMSMQAALKQTHPRRIVAIRVQAAPTASQRVVELTAGGAEAIHLVFDRHGRESPGSSPLRAPAEGQSRERRHVRDVLRDVHGTLVKQGMRDEVTLVASGGIALAEHVAKAIICGADLVAIDIPLLLALECRLCDECERGQPCPIALDEIDQEYGVRRMVNLIGAWRQQLIEMLGAMGIREVRRLRGETGRCMFFEDLERDAFGRLFGRRKSEASQDSAARTTGSKR